MTGAEVVALRPADRVRQDAEPIATIYRNLGTASADRLVSRALGELALTMASLVRQVAAHEAGDLARDLRRLQRLAESLGMVSLGQVATDLRNCLRSGDSTALAAVWARLVRVAERSLATDAALYDRSQI